MNEQAFEWRLRHQRERVRQAIAARSMVTPSEVFAALGCQAERYDAIVAEVLCGHLAALGFVRDDHGTWAKDTRSLVNMEAER